MEIEVFPPFSIHDCEFALYLADDQGNPQTSSSVFLGGKIETLEPDLEFTKIRLDRHGDPLGRNYHTDEEHRFAVKNLWVMDRAGAANGRAPYGMPSIRRNQQYVMVLRWFDQETQCWALRTYLGVTADGHRLTNNDQIFHQELPFTARQMNERSGFLLPPDLTPVTIGYVRYVTASEDTPVYTYDFATKILSGPSSSSLSFYRSSITIAADLLQISFAGVEALHATIETGVHVKDLTAVGGTFPLGTAYPRLEFWIGNSRIAAITAAGELIVPEINEVTSKPVIAGPCFEFVLGATWVLALAQGAAYLTNISDDL